MTAQIERAQGCSRNTTKEGKESINKIRHYIFLNQGHQLVLFHVPFWQIGSVFIECYFENTSETILHFSGECIDFQCLLQVKRRKGIIPNSLSDTFYTRL